MGSRFGPNASGASANYAKFVTETPPVLRYTTVRGWLNFSHALGQVGFPPTMNADASLGCSCAAYHGSIVAMNLREAGEFALNRHVGATSGADTPWRQGVAQRAKVGYYSCCTQSTHVASAISIG